MVRSPQPWALPFLLRVWGCMRRGILHRDDVQTPVEAPIRRGRLIVFSISDGGNPKPNNTGIELQISDEPVSWFSRLITTPRVLFYIFYGRFLARLYRKKYSTISSA